MTRFNSASDTMKLLGVSAQKLYYWRKTGKISFTKIANKTFLYDLTPFTGNTTKRNHIICSRF